MKHSFLLCWKLKIFNTFIMELSLETFLVVSAVLLLSFGQCICFCGQAEYDINGECCPMCAPGNRVYKHCTEFTSTTCVPCVDSTYTAEPNGLPKCLSCTVCDPGQGLRVKIHCTPVSDTVCEALEGFYCTDQYKDSCRQAVEHKTCRPGQYIKHKGTSLTDTVCDGCLDGTYSNGSVEFCQPHLKCEDLGFTLLQPGTNSSNVVCGRNDKVIVIVTSSLAVAALGVAAATGLFIWKRKPNAFAGCVRDTKQTQPTELETLRSTSDLSSLRDPRSTSDSQGAGREDCLGLEERGHNRSIDEEREERNVLVANSNGRAEKESRMGVVTPKEMILQRKNRRRYENAIRYLLAPKD